MRKPRNIEQQIRQQEYLIEYLFGQLGQAANHSEATRLRREIRVAEVKREVFIDRWHAAE